MARKEGGGEKEEKRRGGAEEAPLWHARPTLRKEKALSRLERRASVQLGMVSMRVYGEALTCLTPALFVPAIYYRTKACWVGIQCVMARFALCCNYALLRHEEETYEENVVWG